MARLAVYARANVTGRFADGHGVVVTRGARAGDFPMIKPCRGEIASRVAVVAIRVGSDVPGCFALCPHSVVAPGTLQGCAFENTTPVAGAALDQIVRPGKRKPGEEVIVLLCLLRRHRRSMETHEQHQQAPDWPGDQ